VKLGRYVCFDGQIKSVEFKHIRENKEFAAAYNQVEEDCVYAGWSGWITVPVANSKLVRALL